MNKKTNDSKRIHPMAKADGLSPSTCVKSMPASDECAYFGINAPLSNLIFTFIFFC